MKVKLLTQIIKELDQAEAKGLRVRYGYAEASWFSVDGLIAWRMPLSEDLLQAFNGDHKLEREKTKIFEGINDWVPMMEDWDRLELSVFKKNLVQYDKKRKRIVTELSIFERDQQTFSYVNTKLLKRMFKAGAEYFYQKTPISPIYCYDKDDYCLGVMLPSRINKNEGTENE